MGMNGFKVTLSSKKVVLFRKMEIADYNQACEAAGMKFNSEFGQKAGISTELVKILVVDVDNKRLSALEKETLDKMLDIQDFLELVEVMNKTTGIGEKKAKPVAEFVSIGEKSPGSAATPV